MKVFTSSFITRAAAICVVIVGANNYLPLWNSAANAASLDMQIQMVNSDIARLTAERDEKMARLQSCAKSVNGFKIAGITTLALTGVGIGINIAEHNTISKLNDQIDATKAEIARAEWEKAKQAEIDRLKQQLASQEKQRQQAINDERTGSMANAPKPGETIVAGQPCDAEYDWIGNPQAGCPKGQSRQCIDKKWGECRVPLSLTVTEITPVKRQIAGCYGIKDYNAFRPQIRDYLKSDYANFSADNGGYDASIQQIDYSANANGCLESITYQSKEFNIFVYNFVCNDPNANCAGATNSASAVQQQGQTTQTVATSAVSVSVPPTEPQKQKERAGETSGRSAPMPLLPAGAAPQLAVPAAPALSNLTMPAQVPMTDKQKAKALEEINKKEAQNLKDLRSMDKADAKADLGQVNAARREMSGTISDAQRKQMDDLLKRRYPDLIGAQELSPQEKEELGWLLLQAQQDQAAYGARLDAKAAELKAKIKQSDNQYKLDMAKNKLDGRTISEGIAMDNLTQFQLPANPTSAEVNQGMNLVKKAESEISDLDYEVAPWRNNAEANWLSAADLSYLRGLDARITTDRNTVGQRRAELEQAQRTIDTQQMQDRLKDVRDARQENINKALGL
ncbi:MAG: hypothetical protein FWC61_01900 [Proteobacteria bacterium]|nr:hypothetical protein [Pseudomonadota bacterium]